jgi:non-heme Fe2+,alpha-ketoglutarate-dependent halogenase
MIGILLIGKKLGIPPWLLPTKKLRLIHANWSDEMIREYVFSFATKLPHDQPCKAEVPTSFPEVEVQAENRLSEEELQEFYRQGFLKPFRVCSPEKAFAFGEHLQKIRHEKSSIYGFTCDRDRHLEQSEMMDFISNPAVVDRLAQLLGPDLYLWRSQIFLKPPGNFPVGWHMASTYMFEEYFAEPLLIPPRLQDLFQLTVWFPTTPATEESGCMRFLTGSLCEETRWMRLGGKVGFHAVNYFPDYPIDPERVVSVEVQPGEALVFAERTIHSSGPNQTDSGRMAFNFRVVSGDVQVYPQGHRFHNSGQMGITYDMQHWKGIMLRGEDRTGSNRLEPQVPV